MVWGGIGDHLDFHDTSRTNEFAGCHRGPSRVGCRHELFLCLSEGVEVRLAIARHIGEICLQRLESGAECFKSDAPRGLERFRRTWTVWCAPNDHT